MKRKSICILLLIMSILSVSCSNTTNITEDYVSSNYITVRTDITTKGTLIWELIESQSADIKQMMGDEEVNLHL